MVKISQMARLCTDTSVPFLWAFWCGNHSRSFPGGGPWGRNRDFSIDEGNGVVN